MSLSSTDDSSNSLFFRLKVGDDVRAILDPRLQHLQPTKIRRVRKVSSELVTIVGELTVRHAGSPEIGGG